MERKYYDLIVSLIKNHKKFSDYEAILEDIANDVYERSRVVTDSVTNEDVIIAYLNKVIATSIVTVPKKMNYNTRVRHRVITTLLPQTTTVAPVSIQEKVEALTTEIEAKEEDFSEDVVTVVELQADDQVSNEDITNLSLDMEEVVLPEVSSFEEKNETVQELSDDQEQELEVALSENIELEEPFIEESQDLSLKEGSALTDVDISLVDKMINGVVDENKPDEADLEESSIEVYEDLDSIEPAIEEDVISENIESTDTILVNENSDIEIIEDNSDFVDDIISEPEAFLIEEDVIEDVSLVESAENIEIEDNVLVEEVIEEDLEELTESVEFTNSVDDLSLSDEEPSMINSLDENSLNLDDDSESLVEEETSDSLVLFDASLDGTMLEQDIEELAPVDNPVESNTSFSVPTFEQFSYEPSKKEYDSAEILNEINEIHLKHPDRRILEICDLKYNKRLSIVEISEKIGFTKEQVIDVLNEIIETVKD